MRSPSAEHNLWVIYVALTVAIVLTDIVLTSHIF
jgi:hypothetical protein